MAKRNNTQDYGVVKYTTNTQPATKGSYNVAERSSFSYAQREVTKTPRGRYTDIIQTTTHVHMEREVLTKTVERK